jgi:hypothetical protein
MGFVLTPIEFLAIRVNVFHIEDILEQDARHDAAKLSNFFLISRALSKSTFHLCILIFASKMFSGHKK